MMTEFRKVFVDTSPVIYYLENNAQYRDKIKGFLEECLKEHVQLVTSAITVEEYLVFPYSAGKAELIDNFKRFLAYLNVETVSIDSAIAEQAAKLRGKYRHFKAMDSLQLASAMASGCNLFLTNDKQLRQEKEIPCMTVDAL